MRYALRPKPQARCHCASSRLSNAELTEDVEIILEELDEYYDPSVLESMGAAGRVVLSRNVKVMLKGKNMSDV